MLTGMRVSNFQPGFPRRLMVLHIGLTVACAAVSGQAVSEVYTPPPFGHYQPILDRMPFGALPANFNAATVDPATLKNEAQVKAEQQILAKKINMSAVNVTPDGQTAIGFTDLSQTPPVNYYLLVGADAGGWTVVNADYDEETATIEKEGVSITLKLGKGLVDPTAPAAKPVAMPPSVPTTTAVAAAVSKDAPAAEIPGLSRQVPRSPSPLQPPSPAAAIPPPTAVPAETRSYAERQRARAAQQTEAQIAAEAKQREQLEKLAREAASHEIKRREEETAQEAPAEDAQGQPGQVQ